MVGYLGYDIVRRLERLPARCRGRPAAARAGHAASPPTWRCSTTRRRGRADRQRGQLRRDRRARRRGVRGRGRAAGRDGRGAGPALAVDGRHGRPGRRAGLHLEHRPPAPTPRPWSAAKEEIRAGEAFQIVLSQRFEMPTAADAARRLPGAAGRQPQPVHVPPAPSTGFDIVGSSPEALVTVKDGRAHAAPDRRHALARRHPRGGRRASARSCWPTRRSAPST